MVCAVSRELRYPVNRPLRDDRRALRGNAFVVEREGAQARAVLLARIGDDVDEVAAVTQRAQLIQREERRAGKIGFHAQHAIELDRMADGFVDLQAQAASCRE